MSLSGVNLPLLSAVEKGQTNKVNNLLASPTIRSQVANGNNAVLRMAIEKNHIDIVRILVALQEIRLNITANNNELYLYAVSRNNSTIVNILRSVPEVAAILAPEPVLVLAPVPAPRAETFLRVVPPNFGMASIEQVPQEEIQAPAPLFIEVPPRILQIEELGTPRTETQEPNTASTEIQELGSPQGVEMVEPGTPRAETSTPLAENTESIGATLQRLNEQLENLFPLDGSSSSSSSLSSSSLSPSSRTSLLPPSYDDSFLPTFSPSDNDQPSEDEQALSRLKKAFIDAVSNGEIETVRTYILTDPRIDFQLRLRGIYIAKQNNNDAMSNLILTIGDPIWNPSTEDNKDHSDSEIEVPNTPLTALAEPNTPLTARAEPNTPLTTRTDDTYLSSLITGTVEDEDPMTAQTEHNIPLTARTDDTDLSSLITGTVEDEEPTSPTAEQLINRLQNLQTEEPLAPSLNSADNKRHRGANNSSNSSSGSSSSTSSSNHVIKHKENKKKAKPKNTNKIKNKKTKKRSKRK